MCARDLLLLSLLLLACACKKNEAHEESAPKRAPEGAADAPARAAPEKPAADFSGKLTGIIKLREGADLPTSTLPANIRKSVASVPAGCPPLSEADERTVARDPETQGLSPVHLAVTQMSAAPSREPRTHEVAIEDCRLTPRMLGVMQGDNLRVINRSKTTFLPVLPGDKFMQAILPGATREVPLDAPGSLEVHCGFGGYCGATMLVSVAHSLFTISDRKGHFTIEGIPLGEELIVHAWHPLFEVTSEPFKLSGEEPHKSLELTLSPLPKQAPAP
jgi:hypothetical protein